MLTQFANSIDILHFIYHLQNIIATVLLENIISCLVFIGLGIMGFHPSLLFLRLSSYSGSSSQQRYQILRLKMERKENPSQIYINVLLSQFTGEVNDI